MLIWTDSCRSDNQPCLFLDRDGVINVDRPDYIKNIHELQFYPDSLEALRLTRKKGIRIILISNQSAVNRGIISLQDLWDLHHHMVSCIEAKGGRLGAAIYCPHRPDENCSCRKPSPGMLVKASKLFRIRLDGTFMVGDRLKDLQAAQRAGCQGVFLERGFLESKELSEISSIPAIKRYPTLLEAVSELFG